MIRFIFKQHQPKRFDFKPRFYDERRELLKARVEAIKKEQSSSGGASSPESLKLRMDSAWRQQNTNAARTRSNRNVFLIAAILALVTFLYLSA